jgi:ankyrin repeat protein
MPNDASKVDQDFACAIADGDFQKAALLLTQGADINRIIGTTEVIDRTMYDETTTYLMNSALRGRVEVVRFLLNNGADPNIAGIFSGQTAVLAAARFDHSEVVDLLIEHGADVFPIDSWSKFSAMDYAISHANPAIVRNLFAAGATGTFYRLRYSVEGGEPARETARLLLEHGADINAEDDWGRTSLMWAAERATVDTVQFLIDSGADINRISGKNMNGVRSNETALQLARRAKRDDVIALLLRHGAATVPANYERSSILASIRRTLGW